MHFKLIITIYLYYITNKQNYKNKPLIAEQINANTK